jgi:hypothetical protein
MPECLGDLPCLHPLELLAPPPTQPPCKQRVRFVRLQCPATPKWPCITSASRVRRLAEFRGLLSRDGNSWLSQTWRFDGCWGRRIRLTGLLREKPW